MAPAYPWTMARLSNPQAPVWSSSLVAISLRWSTLLPMYTPMVVSKELPHVSKDHVASEGTVHLYQSDWMGMETRASFGSPGSPVAPVLLSLTEPLVPLMAWALTKSSLWRSSVAVLLADPRAARLRPEPAVAVAVPANHDPSISANSVAATRRDPTPSCPIQPTRLRMSTPPPGRPSGILPHRCHRPRERSLGGRAWRTGLAGRAATGFAQAFDGP